MRAATHPLSSGPPSGSPSVSGCHALPSRPRRPLLLRPTGEGGHATGAHARQTTPTRTTTPTLQNEPTRQNGSPNPPPPFSVSPCLCALCVIPRPTANRPQPVQPSATPCNPMQPGATTRAGAKRTQTPFLPCLNSNRYNIPAPETLCIRRLE
jgi:hypothetical protein